jgi:hypothetical protein
MLHTLFQELAGVQRTPCSDGSETGIEFTGSAAFFRKNGEIYLDSAREKEPLVREERWRPNANNSMNVLAAGPAVKRMYSSSRLVTLFIPFVEMRTEAETGGE